MSCSTCLLIGDLAGSLIPEMYPHIFGLTSPAIGFGRATTQDQQSRQQTAPLSAGPVRSISVGTFLAPTVTSNTGALECSTGERKISKKRAIVAVARKLAVLLHRPWVTGVPTILSITSQPLPLRPDVLRCLQRCPCCPCEWPVPKDCISR